MGNGFATSVHEMRVAFNDNSLRSTFNASLLLLETTPLRKRGYRAESRKSDVKT